MVMVGRINRIDVTGRLCIGHLSGIDNVCEVAVVDSTGSFEEAGPSFTVDDPDMV